MIATVDLLTVSGWVFGALSLGLGVYEIIRRKFISKDREAMESHLRSIGQHLSALHTSIVETHKASDVIKTDVGKRFLSDVAYHVVATILQVEEALGMKSKVPAPLTPPSLAPMLPSVSSTLPITIGAAGDQSPNANSMPSS